MNRTDFVVRNLRYHMRGNFALLLGSAVGAAVLTGALFVGDSLRGSLKDRTERQLGSVDSILIGAKFLRADLAAELPGQVRGALLLQGTVRTETPEGERRVGKVTVWGVNQNFGIRRPELDGDEPSAILSANLAKSLDVKVGDTVFVGVQKASAMPRASILSKRGISDTTRTMKLTVTAILADSDPANALSLSISPTLPSNMFIPMARLQREIGQEGAINSLLASGESAQSLQLELRKHLKLDDWGLKVRVAEFRKRYISVDSKQLLLDLATVRAVEKTAEQLGLQSAKTYVYLANSIVHGKQGIPYSIVAALDPTKAAPLGPFLPMGVSDLQPGDIVLADWKDSPIKIDPTEKNPKITLKYYKPEIEGRIETDERSFNFRGYVPLSGAADDRDLTPDFPGITQQANIKNWNPPFEIDQTLIKDRDEKFWNQFRTTPKAYIRLDDGQELWGTRFGDVTSIRIAPKDGVDMEKIRAEFAARLLGNLDPEAAGLNFLPIRERMLAAGQGSTDFGMLFLAFSFFLIVAALLLVGLLFRLNLDRRASEIGLLRASGFPLRTVRRLLLIEGLILATTGALIGIAGAFAYADAMIRLLIALWPTPGVETYLSLHVAPLSIAIGFGSSILMSGLAIIWALRSLSRIAPSQLLKGETTVSAKPRAASRWPMRIAITAVAGAIGLAVAAPSLPPGEAQAGTFFGSGFLLLGAGLALLWAWMKRSRHHLVNGHGALALAKLGTRNAVRNPTRSILTAGLQAGTFFGSGFLLLGAGLALLWAWMKRSRHHLVNGRGALALAKLGTRNAVRNPTRSILTAGLLASAAFLLVAVESFRREPEKDFADKKGGSGGFPLLAESSTPIDFDLNDDDGKSQIEDGLKPHYQERNMPFPVSQPLVKRALEALDGVTVYRFRVQRGDDASCLNLYQASRPRLLGVPRNIIDRSGFSFADSISEKDNPWKQLVMPKGPAEGIPCIVEQNTAMWMLKKGLGDTFEVPDEENRPLKLRIVALLKDSVFQSEVLIPDAAFRRHFPHTEGFGYFLLDVPPGKEAEVSRTLITGLASYGFETTPTRDRVASFLAVQNMYLSTFQLLGGFGLMLGVLGLSVVLLRSIWERRAEMALLRALGFRVRALNGIVLAENALLLVLGLGAGVIAALAAVAPHIVSGGHIPWIRLAVMLGVVFVVGLTVALIAIVSTLRAPLIPALRRE